MSTRAKLTFAASALTCFGIVTYVHVVHKLERDEVKSGVKIDLERQEKKKQDLERQEKKKQNILMIEEQNKLTEVLRNAEKNQQS